MSQAMQEMEIVNMEADNSNISSNLNISIPRGALLKSLSRLQGLVEKRNTVPILSNIKLDAAENSVTLTATDMDIMASENVEANVSQSGSLTVRAQTFYDIIRKLPDGADVSLSTDQNSTQLIIESGNSRFALSYLPSQDFPVMPIDQSEHKFTLPSSEILKLLDKTRFAASTEETRYYLNGVFFQSGANEQQKEIFRGVATDGHRLALVEIDKPEGSADISGIIIPRKTVNEVNRLLEDSDNDVEIGISGSKIRFSFGAVELRSKLVDGTFPDYERVIPKNNDKVLDINTKQFMDAVDRVSTISSEKTRSVRLVAENNGLTLSSQSPDAGSATETIDANYTAEQMQIGFNARYMLEMLSHIDGQQVHMQLSQSDAPALVHDPADASQIYVIMPMRV